MNLSTEIVLCDNVTSSRKKLKTALEADGHNINVVESIDLIFEIKNVFFGQIIVFNGHSYADYMQTTELIIQHLNMPLIVLSDDSNPNNRCFALELGVFEFIVSPYLLKEVLIHVQRAIKLKTHLYSKNFLIDQNFDEFGDFFWNRSSRELRTKKGFLINLTETEAAILDLFVRNPEKELSRDEIWYSLRKRERWPLDRTLDGHIARLRAKIQDTTEGTNSYIKSVRGKGYIFTPFAFFKSFDEMASRRLKSVFKDVTL